MKSNYNKSIVLKCVTCGDTDFEYNEDKTFIKCNRCNTEYNGGYDELKDLNQETIEQELEELKSEVIKDARKDIEDMLKKAFKGEQKHKI